MHTLIVLQAVINGLFLAGIYALLAYGFNIIVGVTKVFDITYGAVIMLNMLVLWSLYTQFKVPLYLAFLIILLLSPSLGFIINKCIISPLLERGPASQFIATFGATLLLIHLCLYVWKAEYKAIPIYLPSIRLDGIMFGSSYVAVFIVSLIVFSATTVFLTKTTVGCKLRATAQDADGAKVVGINLKRMYILATIIGYFIAAICAFLLAFIFPITPHIGLDFVVLALVIVVIGGEGSFKGSLVAGLILGLIHSLLGYYLTVEWGTIVAFFLLMLILFLRPQGLFGERG